MNIHRYTQGGVESHWRIFLYNVKKDLVSTRYDVEIKILRVYKFFHLSPECYSISTLSHLSTPQPIKSEQQGWSPSCGIWRDLGLGGLNDLLSVRPGGVWTRKLVPSSLSSSFISLPSSFLPSPPPFLPCFHPSVSLTLLFHQIFVGKEPKGTFLGAGNTGMRNTWLPSLRRSWWNEKHRQGSHIRRMQCWKGTIDV